MRSRVLSPDLRAHRSGDRGTQADRDRHPARASGERAVRRSDGLSTTGAASAAARTVTDFARSPCGANSSAARGGSLGRVCA